MAQVISVSPGVFSGKNVAQALSNVASTVVLEFTVPAFLFRIGVNILPKLQALTAFLVEAKFHPDGAYVTINSAITTTIVPPVISASSTLAALAANTNGWFTMDVKGMCAVRISATCANDTTGTLDVYAAGLA